MSDDAPRRGYYAGDYIAPVYPKMGPKGVPDGVKSTRLPFLAAAASGHVGGCAAISHATGRFSARNRIFRMQRFNVQPVVVERGAVVPCAAATAALLPPALAPVHRQTTRKPSCCHLRRFWTCFSLCSCSDGCVGSRSGEPGAQHGRRSRGAAAWAPYTPPHQRASLHMRVCLRYFPALYTPTDTHVRIESTLCCSAMPLFPCLGGGSSVCACGSVCVCWLLTSLFSRVLSFAVFSVSSDPASPIASTPQRKRQPRTGERHTPFSCVFSSCCGD